MNMWEELTLLCGQYRLKEMDRATFIKEFSSWQERHNIYVYLPEERSN